MDGSCAIESLSQVSVAMIKFTHTLLSLVLPLKSLLLRARAHLERVGIMLVRLGTMLVTVISSRFAPRLGSHDI
jgi:hypothetical protein